MINLFSTLINSSSIPMEFRPLVVIDPVALQCPVWWPLVIHTCFEIDLRISEKPSISERKETPNHDDNDISNKMKI